MSKFFYESNDEIKILITKHLQGQHDQRTHGSWSGGAGVDITSKLDKVFYASALKRDRGNRNEETQIVIDEIQNARRSKGSSTGDVALQIIAERQGFDGKPKLVKTVNDLQEIQKTEGGNIVYRGIADYEDKEGEGVSYTGAQAASDFRSGEYYAGFGMFGNGIYTTNNLDGAVAYASMKDDRYGRKGNGSTIAMLIPKDAKRAPREVVKEAIKTAQEESAPMWGLRATHRNDIGRILAARGYQYYDAGDVQNNKIGNFVILDRTMLTVAEEDVK